MEAMETRTMTFFIGQSLNNSVVPSTRSEKIDISNKRPRQTFASMIVMVSILFTFAAEDAKEDILIART
jgi:hypothetical protein